VDYVESGRPIVGLRTATHAFDLRSSPTYARYSWNGKAWDGGFGRQVLGETWIGHHGEHGKQSTRGILVKGAESHPIFRGIHDGDIWGPTDVYEVRLPLPGDSRPLVLGQVLAGMHPDDPPAPGKANDPMLPVAWVKTYKTARFHHYHGRRAGSVERGSPPHDRERWLLGSWDGVPHPGEIQRGSGGRLPSVTVRLRGTSERRQTPNSTLAILWGGPLGGPPG